MTLKWGFAQVDQQAHTTAAQFADDAIMYADAAQLKPRYWRIEARWSIIAKAKDPSAAGARDWSMVDSCINDILLTGAEVVLIVGVQRPTWGGWFGWGGTQGTATDFGNFVAECATRYKPSGPGIRTDGKYAVNAGKGVTIYECWNEMNNSVFWGANIDIPGYVQHLKAGHDALKAVTGLSGSNSTWLFGGLQHVPRVGPWYGYGTQTIDEVAFVTQAYAVGAQGYFDAMNLHIYPQSDTVAFNGSTLGPEPTSTIDNIKQLIDIRALMVANGDTAKTIWITEAGFATATAPTGSLTSALQNTYTQELYTLLAGLSYVETILFYNVRDSGTDLTNFNNGFGYMTYNFVAKPLRAWLAGFTNIVNLSGTTSAGVTSTGQMQGGQVRAQLAVKSKLSGTTTIGVVASGTLVNRAGNMLAATNVGVTSTAAVTAKPLSGSTTVGVTTVGTLKAIGMSGTTLVGIVT